jgi:hypothetical protein
LASDEEAAQAYVQHEVLGYISRRPEARDTIEGIIDWWLFDQRRTLARETISAAIEGLVASGALVEIPMASGDPLYSAPSRSPQQE